MAVVFRQWESKGRSHSEDWIEIISRGDAEAMWTKLFYIVSRHSAVRSLATYKDLSWDSLQEMCCDLTQDLYLRLQEKDRWQYYVDVGYSSEKVEHELYGIEIPNLVSRLLRERYPESYRIARRTSNLLTTKKEFRCYSRPGDQATSANPEIGVRAANKMVLQVYGLATWPPNKSMQQQQHLQEMMKEVSCRMRDTRRAGRGSTSQVVISNSELTELIIDIFQTINSPTDVRTMRSLVLSKLAVEDSKIVSIEETLEPTGARPEPIKMEFADRQPTPEEAVLEKEMARRMEALAESILQTCRERVRNKPQRFRKLVEVVWHCYFNPSSPSQTSVARLMKISDSLVSHYRKIFDTVVRSETLAADKALELDECVCLNTALDKRVTELIVWYQASDQPRKHQVAHSVAPARYMVASASKR